MRKTSERKRKREGEELYDWETDYDFYLDQFHGIRTQRLGQADWKLHLEQQKTKQLMRKG